MGCCGPFVRSLGAAGASGGGRDDPPASAASSSIQGTLTSPLGPLAHVRCATCIGALRQPAVRWRCRTGRLLSGVIRLAWFGRAAKACGAAGRSSPLLASLCCAGIGVICCRMAAPRSGRGGFAPVRPERGAVVLLPVVPADGTGPVDSDWLVCARACGWRWRTASAGGAVLLAGLPGGSRRLGRGGAGCGSAAGPARRRGARPGAAGGDRTDAHASRGDDPRGR